MLINNVRKKKCPYSPTGWCTNFKGALGCAPKDACIKQAI